MNFFYIVFRVKYHLFDMIVILTKCKLIGILSLPTFAQKKKKKKIFVGPRPSKNSRQ